MIYALFSNQRSDLPPFSVWLVNGLAQHIKQLHDKGNILPIE